MKSHKRTMTTHCLPGLTVLCLWQAGALAQPQTQTFPLSDGVLLKSAQGNLVRHVKESTWSFLLKYDSVVGQTRLKAGMLFPLLSNTTLEAMLADRQDHANAIYWLWARVTRYKNRNYLFPMNFVPMQEAGPSGSDQADEPSAVSATAGRDQALDSPTPEDRLAIPAFIKEQRKGQSVVRSRSRSTRIQPNVKLNRIILDRTGHVEQQRDGFVFVYDALGQNRQVTHLRLLPCDLLESMEKQQARHPDTIDFKIAGIQTQFRGESFLLVRRCTRAFSHGNFKR